MSSTSVEAEGAVPLTVPGPELVKKKCTWLVSSVEAEGAVGANIGHSRGCITILMESSQQGKIKQKDSIFDNILGSCGYKHIFKCGSALSGQFRDLQSSK